MRSGSLDAGAAALMTCKTYKLPWSSPFGPVTLTVTDTKTFFSRHHVVDIGLPPDTPFPLETLSYVATGAEIQRAGGAAGFVEKSYRYCRKHRRLARLCRPLVEAWPPGHTLASRAGTPAQAPPPALEAQCAPALKVLKVRSATLDDGIRYATRQPRRLLQSRSAAARADLYQAPLLGHVLDLGPLSGGGNDRGKVVLPE